MDPDIFHRPSGISTSRNWRPLSYVAPPLVLAALSGAFMLQPTPVVQAAPDPVVVVATPLVRDIDQWDDYIGRFTPSKAVDVRPRVSGQITALHFHDGDAVAKGQLLFSLDQRPFRAALAEAQAGVSNARSALTLARTDVQRSERLQGDEAISAREIDSLRARLQAAEADVAAARARAQARSLDLEFTQVRAPISGRISDRRVDAGNLVSGDGAAATLLTTINALDPIYFTFDASEALFMKASRQQALGHADVEVKLQSESNFAWKGKLDFTDNTLDPRSGTIRGRATIANPRMILTPGMFGNMRMAAGRGKATLVPDSAVQTDQADRTVLVLGKDNIVATRKVRLGPVVEGLRVVLDGLTLKDRVVIAGLQSVAAGAKAHPQRGSITPMPDTTSPFLVSSEPSASQATFGAN